MTELPEKPVAIDAKWAGGDLRDSGPVRLAWRAAWFDQRAFAAVDASANPLSRGLLALLVAVAAAALARLIGTALGIATSPQIGILQDQLLRAITETGYFSNLAQQSPDFAAQFNTGYAAVWDLIRLAGGYPSYSGLGSSLASLLLILASWFVYTSTTFVIAHWFGSYVNFRRALGVFALAYTPIMLTVVEVIAGARVPWSLIFLLIMIAKFFAAREVYGVGTGSSLAIILLPYVLGIILLVGLLIFGAALGLNQIPFVDEFLRTLRFGGFFGG